MNAPAPRRNPWRIATLNLWLVLFLTGLVPEAVFEELRALGGVVTQRALINSPSAITVAFAVYFAVFALKKCREAGLSEHDAENRALQLGVLALLAFLPYPFEILLDVPNIPSAYLRGVVYVLGPAKLVAWAYLLALLVRYYALGHRNAFAPAGLAPPESPPPTADPGAPEAGPGGPED